MAVRVEKHAEPIPGYQLIERIGGGGFGEVWKAEAPGGLHKAIKFVFGDLSSAGDSQRAEQELKALKRVQTVRHPYILTLERYDIIDGQLMIVMELADRSLWDEFKEWRAKGAPGIPREDLLRYMEESAEALDLMNLEYQLQHLDIKPQNIFLIHNHIKVADFGLVKDLENSQASVTGGITPVYAAPETFDGKVTRYSDQYSLAILYQELLTGQRPFSGTTVRQLIMQHLEGVPNVTPLPVGERPIIARALSKTPADRYPTCRELVRALRATTPSVSAVSPSNQGQLLAGHSTIPTPVHGVVPSTGSFQGVITGSYTAQLNRFASPSETPSSQEMTQNIRALAPAVLRPTEQGTRIAPAQELTGTGSLFPALVLGLGQMGLSVLQKTRETLHILGAPLAQLSNLRFLLLDTDAEVIRTASAGRCHPAATLSAAEFLLAPLNRPSHYLKPRDGRPAVESWLNPKMLYRIPRSQVTTGVRALGRLAFIDNYRPVMRRIQQELDALADHTSLRTAAEVTGLGLRTSRPRVYIVASLGGGSGSGMFLDLAYNVRALLKQMGYEHPDVVGILLLPPVDNNRTRVASLGNSYAALTELKHYSSPGNVFRARYHEREPALEDPDPPFSRTIVLPLPDEADESRTREAIELCAEYMHRDMATPFGRAADLGRAGLPSPPWEQRGLYTQTFGMHRLSWPRHALLESVSRELCRRTVGRWLSRDNKPIREAVAEWVQEQWVFKELGADTFIHRTQSEMIKALGRPVDGLIRDVVEPLASSVPDTPVKGKGKGESRGLSIEQVAAVLKSLEEMVGVPGEDPPPNTEPPRLVGALRQIIAKLGAEWSQQLVELPVQLIEHPRFRLAGAEEAIRLIVSNVEQILQHQEPLAHDLAEKALSAHDHLRVAAGRPARQGSKLTPKSSEQIVELCKQFGKYQFQQQLLSLVSAAFVGVRGHLSDELREVNFCRVRLTELQRLFEEAPGPKPTPSKQGTIGRVFFVSGCKDLSEAVSKHLETVTYEQMLELDGEIEQMLRTTFTALVYVCLSTQSVLKPLEKAMLETASKYASKHLPPTSVASLFLEPYDNPLEAECDAGGLFDKAAPDLPAGRPGRPGAPQVEFCVLATPNDEPSEQFREMVKRAKTEIEYQTAVSIEDIVIYRERMNVALTDLEHLGTTGHDAYTQMNSADHFTPHARTDVDFRHT